jgi:hypothetical protein
MSAVVALTPKTVTIQGFQLLAPEDMLTALTYLTGQGYTGQLSASLEGGTVKWSLGLYSELRGTGQTAYIDDWIILSNGTTALVCAANQFSTFYTVT